MKIGNAFRAGFGGIVPAVLAVLLTVQFAFMHAPTSAAQGGAGIEVVLCTEDGLQTITLDLSAGTPQDRPAVPHGAKCPLCITGAVLVFDQPDRALAAVEFHPVRYPLAAGPRSHPARPVRSAAIRAPPLTV
ncbi:DUF2946 family protein [Antarcticimicrobium luteum]|uniref:DUF2946 domain-containing protein n=1 Tax=Antarcticimicrobium luteum TaxID=2547397 RepID=A0A4R5UQ58_9RHOB|nr:DUF2946 family protein [Antarcticimicrobium luteum]TDK41158.1 DUF2946 domain-containing protein [Antarcticimicrobium luteum]